MKKTLAAFGLAALIGGCATTPAFKPVNTVERVIKGYKAELTLSDTNEDKKYDEIIVNTHDKSGKLKYTLRLTDEDFDGLLDTASIDIVDKNGKLGPDGQYDKTVGFERYFEEVSGVKPTNDEKKVNVFYQILSGGIE